MELVERLLILVLFLTGFSGISAAQNLIKKIFGLTLINSAVVILFITEGGRIGINTPIMEEGINQVTDPVPQALMLTAIVVGVCVTALALAMVYRLYKTTGSLDINKIREKLKND